MITVDIKPSRSWFGIPNKRKQWNFKIRGANGEPLDPRDTYANVNDIKSALRIIRDSDIQVRVHYRDGVETSVMRAPTRFVMPPEKSDA